MVYLVLQIQQVFPVSVVQHVSHDTEAQVDHSLEVLAALELAGNTLLGVRSEVGDLNLTDSGQMVLQLFRFDLLEVVTTQNHVLDELRKLLVKLHDVGFTVYKLLNIGPFLEFSVDEFGL